MISIRETLVYLREFRGQLCTDINDYLTGVRTTAIIRNGTHFVDTHHMIAELKRRLAKIDNLIAVYEEHQDD